MSASVGARDGSIRQMWDIEQIRNLKSRYFQAVDEKDFGVIASMFTEDAVIDFSGEIAHRIGHQGITAEGADPAAWRVVGGIEAARVIAESVRDLVTVHQGHDPQITLTGDDTARGRWSLHDIMEFPGETMHGFGHYREQYRREGDHWRISQLILTRLRVAWEPAIDGESA